MKTRARSKQPAAVFAVRAGVAAHLRALPARRVLVACSGGPDSTVLLDAVAAMHDDVAVACVDHQLRAESGAEAERVVAGARARSLPAEVLRVTVDKRSQDGARRARYAALAAEAERVGADVVCVGHTATDQLETLLDRLVRGAGLRGLAAMRAGRALGPSVRLARPLLAFTRADVEAYLAALTPPVAVVRDPSNGDLRYRRSRIRHQIVPLLRAERADIDGAIGALCDRLAAEDEALDFAAARAAAEATRDDGLDVGALSALPSALRARVLLRTCPTPLSSAHVAALVALVESSAGSAALHLPGVLAERRYGRLRFVAARACDTPAPRTITEPGRYAFGRGDVELDAPTLATLGAPLVLRALLPGDRTATGRRLSRLLSDRKIPRADRHQLPCLARPEAPSIVLWMATILGDGPRFFDGKST